MENEKRKKTIGRIERAGKKRFTFEQSKWRTSISNNEPAARLPDCIVITQFPLQHNEMEPNWSASIQVGPRVLADETVFTEEIIY